MSSSDAVALCVQGAPTACQLFRIVVKPRLNRRACTKTDGVTASIQQFRRRLVPVIEGGVLEKIQTFEPTFLI
jgi:hypothetical protein